MTWPSVRGIVKAPHIALLVIALSGAACSSGGSQPIDTTVDPAEHGEAESISIEESTPTSAPTTTAAVAPSTTLTTATTTAPTTTVPVPDLEEELEELDELEDLLDELDDLLSDL